MTLKIKNRDYRKKRQFIFFKLALFSLFFLLFSNSTFSQDSISEKEDLSEKAELNFQQYFFKALSEKSIGNYQKAIENLESCNQILQNDVSVFFEFSKNYLLLNNTLLAKEYINRSLAKDANNIWMLKHLIKIYQKERNYKEAIKVQLKIVAINPKEREFLARLYALNREYKKSLSVINVLEKENTLSSNLKRLRNNLKKVVDFKIDKQKTSDLSSLIHQFKTNKSYKILEEILKKSTKNNDLLKFCEEGIALFPAQPYVYLVKGSVLNYQKNYKKALTTLQSGIDFVIEDKMEADFYIQIAQAFKGLGNTKEENKYKLKAKKLKR